MGDTSAAIAANRKRGLEKMADRLRAAGYTVIPPDGAAGPRRVQFTPPVLDVANGRSSLTGRSEVRF